MQMILGMMIVHDNGFQVAIWIRCEWWDHDQRFLFTRKCGRYSCPWPGLSNRCGFGMDTWRRLQWARSFWRLRRYILYPQIAQLCWPNTILQLSDFQCSIREHRSTHTVFRYHDPSACITFACTSTGLKLYIFWYAFFPVSLAWALL